MINVACPFCKLVWQEQRGKGWPITSNPYVLMCPRCDTLGKVVEVKTVPLTLGGKVIGEADVETSEAGVHVMTTRITDPDVIKMLEIDIGPMAISRRGESE